MSEGLVMDHKAAKCRSGLPKMLILKQLQQLNHEFEIYLKETLRMFLLHHRKHISPLLQQKTFNPTHGNDHRLLPQE
jgi:hypothetical protein